MGSAVVNEMYSHPGLEQGSAATAADLLLFDPLGIFLFSHDGVARFFAQRLRATIWSSQAGLTERGELVNNGNNIIFIGPSPKVIEKMGDKIDLYHHGWLFMRKKISEYCIETIISQDGKLSIKERVAVCH